MEPYEFELQARGHSAGPASQRGQQQGLARGLLPPPMPGVFRLKGGQLASALVRPRRLREPGAQFQGFSRFAKTCSRHQSAFMSTKAEVKIGAREYQSLMVDFRIDGLQFDRFKAHPMPLDPHGFIYVDAESSDTVMRKAERSRLCTYCIVRRAGPYC